MKRILYMLVVAVFAVMASSCVSQHAVNKNMEGGTPDQTRLLLTMNDYTYLGEVTVSVTYKTYLGIFRKMLTINEQAYDSRQYVRTYLRMKPQTKLGILSKALYKVVDEYPSADYVIPVSHVKKVEHMTAGREIREEMTVKVFTLSKTVEEAE